MVLPQPRLPWEHPGDSGILATHSCTCHPWHNGLIVSKFPYIYPLFHFFANRRGEGGRFVPKGHTEIGAGLQL